MDATVSDWNGSTRNDHSKLPKNLICCNHHFIFSGLKKRPFLTRFFCTVNDLVTVTQNSPGNHGAFDPERSKIFNF